MVNDILVEFDLDKKTAYVTGQIKGLELMDRKPYSLVCASDQPNIMLCFEIKLPTIDSEGKYVPPNSNWEFTYKQFSKHRQTLQLEQFVPFPISDNVFYPKNLDSRTNLAFWSYIANPSKGTIQTNKVTKVIYHPFERVYNLKMTVKGDLSVKGWSTDD